MGEGDWFIQCECVDCPVCYEYVKVNDELFEEDELRLCTSCYFNNHNSA